MKNIALFASTLCGLGLIMPAHSYTPHTYANGISAYNIAAMQHTITQTAFNSFAISMGSNLKINSAQRALPAPTPTKPLYGTMPLYGEYNDDGSMGRSGGNSLNADAALNNVWINWQHLNADASLNNTNRLDSDFDIIMSGISGGQTKLGTGLAKWGIYTGYVGGTQENHDISMDEQGGFFGIYNGFQSGNFQLSTTINGGVMDNSADGAFGTDEYTNFWVGAMFNATYNIAMDDTFTIQPGVQAGYTWIKSENYTSASGDILENDAFGIFEVAPSIRAIKHIGNGWYGALNAKYVMIFANGGDLAINGTATETLEMDNFMEYGISLEKSIASVNATINFGRQDGARDGWFGGLKVKYAF